MKGVRFNPLAERELTEAIQHYFEISPELGQGLQDEVEHGLIFLLRYPEAAPRVLGPIRRLVLQRFPYNLLYRPLKGGGLRILAVAHQKRRPWYWTGRK
jgi:toxin ParE1/3/4